MPQFHVRTAFIWSFAGFVMFGAGGLAILQVASNGTRAAAEIIDVAAIARDDGPVSDEDHERAIATTIACIRDTGVEVLVRPSEGKRRTTFLTSGDTRNVVSNRTAEQLTKDCIDKHLARANAAWAMHKGAALTADERMGAQSMFAECASAAGTPADSASALLQLVVATNDDRLANIAGNCIDHVEVAFGFQPN